MAAFLSVVLGVGPGAPAPALAFDPFGDHSLARHVSQVPFGRSSQGRPLRVLTSGWPGSDRRVLVIGCVHGDECAGKAVTRELARGCPLAATDLWVVHQLNPDGPDTGTRLNGRGVDLNRNFSRNWRPIGRRWDPQYSGPRPFSEPESRAARRLIRRFRPDVTIWFHQQAERLVRAWGPSVRVARAYAEEARAPFHKLPWLAGTAPNWQNNAFPGTSSFVVELGLGRASRLEVRRHVRAIRSLLEAR
jgi:protein MpaA